MLGRVTGGADRGRNRRQHVLGLTQRCELDEPHAVGKSACQVCGRLDREPRLPHPAGPGDGDETHAFAAQQAHEAVAILLAPEQRRRRHRQSYRRRDRRGRGQLLVLVQDRVMERLQLRSRVDPELVHESRTRRGVGIERLGLPPGAVEREHQLPAQSFPQRLLADERLELADELGVAATFEIGVETRLDRDKPELLQPCDLGLRPALVREVCEGGAAPELERRSELGGSLERGELRRCGKSPLELGAVQLLGREIEAVPVCLGGDRLRPERLAELRDVALDRGLWPPRCLLRPERLDQRIGRDRPPTLEGQHGEDRPLLAAAERQRNAVPPRRQRAEESELDAAAGRHPSWRPTLAPSSEHEKSPVTEALPEEMPLRLDAATLSVSEHLAVAPEEELLHPVCVRRHHA